MADTLSKTARSTLSPGVTSEAIAALRDSALREMDSAEAGKSKVETLKFDFEHDTPAPTHDDDDNWVARYPGQNSPHIGNGSGGVR